MRLIAIVLSWACLALGADQDSAVNGMWQDQMDWPSQLPGDNLSKRQRVLCHLSPACASISRNWPMVRMSADCATSFPVRS